MIFAKASGRSFGLRFHYVQVRTLLIHLHDELTAMQANQLLGLKPTASVRPRLGLLGELSPVLKSKFREAIGCYEREVGFIAEARE